MANKSCTPRPHVGALALAGCVVVAGCSTAAGTPEIIYITPPPAITPIVIYVTPAPAITPIVIYVTPAPSATPATTPSPGPAATPTPVPTPTPTSPAAGCSGSDDNRAFFAEAAAAMKWTVYCAVLPAGWHVYNGTYAYAPDGMLEVDYQGPGTSWVTLVEGDLCGKGGMSMCTWHTLGVDQGPAAFGNLPAELWVRTLDPPYVAVGADYNSTHEYLVHTADVTVADTRTIAADMIAVPKP
jgi:hypothetical protein